MHTILRPLSVFFLFLFSTFLWPGSAAYAELPVLKTVAKWETIKNSPAPIAQAAVPGTTKVVKAVHSGKAAPVILGSAYTISQVKKRIGPLVTAATTKRLNRKISSRSAIIIDAVSGKTLYSRNPDNPRQPASTIKIITGMIAIKSLKNSDQISVSPKAARQPRSKIYLDQNKRYRANDLINAVLLASANDASVAIAEKIAGNEKDFAKMMTLRAKLWGARHTVCKTASGLTAKGQKSTARDLATIFRYVMNDREFSSRMKKTKVRTSEGKLLRNHNKALWQVDGTLGGKTGFTNAARQTYVGKFKRGKDEIIVAIMGSETMWADIKHLVNYGFKKKVAMSSEMNALGADIELVAEL